ncbi:hypothetical protein KGR20_15760 [Cytobacillus oceanisediminis]|uniref:ParM/StbA family protein n=1 Tax=Cytobacillus oceanisediminis TaxID=665099 RepID=UPI001CCE1AB2|nr:hypothetical protein [Cytobacillus oceanisediminis]MBZ9535683.1 hypothetical protein [Cytobacillus oceanisediminis]
MIVGMDPGNYETKIVTPYGAFQTLSCLGEYRELKIDKGLGKEDIFYEFKGEKGFAAKLALKESLFKRQMAGDSKAHEDALIRILIALHQFTDDNDFDIVVNQPIVKHKQDKIKMVDMIQRKHVIKVNDMTKTMRINKISVAPEGAISYWALEKPNKLERIIDVGSGTVNAATILDGEFIDLESFTLTFGANSEEVYDIKNLASAIIAKTTIKGWKKTEHIRVCGGIAELVAPLLSQYFAKAIVIKPKIRVGTVLKILQPTFANAVGCYELASELYG